MRIAGRQYFETMRIAMDVKKKLEGRDPAQGGGSKPGADDGEVTTQHGGKPSLFGVLWPDSQSGQTPGQTAGHTTHAHHATSGHKPQQPPAKPADGDTDKPSDSQVDIYV
jgi:hypothetical protein